MCVVAWLCVCLDWSRLGTAPRDPLGYVAIKFDQKMLTYFVNISVFLSEVKWFRLLRSFPDSRRHIPPSFFPLFLFPFFFSFFWKQRARRGGNHPLVAPRHCSPETLFLEKIWKNKKGKSLPWCLFEAWWEEYNMPEDIFNIPREKKIKETVNNWRYFAEPTKGLSLRKKRRYKLFGIKFELWRLQLHPFNVWRRFS